jgi:hypothetical protein
MDVMYFRTVARRCLVAARASFDVHAIEEFIKLAADFTQKAAQLERTYQDHRLCTAAKLARPSHVIAAALNWSNYSALPSNMLLVLIGSDLILSRWQATARKNRKSTISNLRSFPVVIMLAQASVLLSGRRTCTRWR